MELTREHIIKALECCYTDKRTCSDCPFQDPDKYMECEGLALSALALIKELTQECNKWQGRIKIECDYTKAATVRELRERLTTFFAADDILKYVEVDAEYINEQIDRIAKEMEEKLS